MRVMVIVKATTDSEAGKLPSRELMAAMGAFNHKLMAAGVMVDGRRVEADFAGRARRLRRRPSHGEARAVRNRR